MAAPALKDLPKVATDLKTQLEGFNPDKLKNADTQEKIVLPTAEDVATEKTQQTLIAGIEKFDTSKLKHAETQEKIVLPDKTAIEEERGKQQLFSGIENFDASKLKHTETCEKNPLHSGDEIRQILLGLQTNTEITPPRKGQVGAHRQQHASSQEIRDRILRYVGQE